ncbi:MAG: sulfotransferase [Actinomycetota bacterium]|nr:sulfotransferase [Actinomycetota bacterium]MDQ6948256.1 sulfotransferase [Actinomycetota bacterium]
MKRVLVTGLPRSGTTWVANVLGQAPGAVLVQEPDNPDANPLAASVKADLGLHPVLAPGEESPRYRQLWELAYAGGWPTGPGLLAVARQTKKLPPRVLEGVLRPAAAVMTRIGRPGGATIAKSVLVTLCLEWLEDQFAPIVVVVERNPLNVIASWLELDIPLGGLDTDAAIRARFVEPMGLAPLAADRSRLERTAWCVGFLTAVSRRSQSEHPDRMVVTHEQLCACPAVGFQRLFDLLGLTWTDVARHYIDTSNRSGTGYATTRLAAQVGEKWRTVLSDDDVSTVRAILDRFPLTSDDRIRDRQDGHVFRELGGAG